MRRFIVRAPRNLHARARTRIYIADNKSRGLRSFTVAAMLRSALVAHANATFSDKMEPCSVPIKM